MPTYISLYNLTDQGIRNIKDAPGRVEEAIKGAEAMGARMPRRSAVRMGGSCALDGLGADGVRKEGPSGAQAPLRCESGPATPGG